LQRQAATQLLDMVVPPGNRLGALKGGRAGLHGIRSTINNGSASDGNQAHTIWKLWIGIKHL